MSPGAIVIVLQVVEYINTCIFNIGHSLIEHQRKAAQHVREFQGDRPIAISSIFKSIIGFDLLSSSQEKESTILRSQFIESGCGGSYCACRLRLCSEQNMPASQRRDKFLCQSGILNIIKNE